MRIGSAVVVLAALIAPVVARAQVVERSGTETVIHEADKQVIEKRSHVDFSDSVLNAEHNSPQSSYRLVLPGKKFKSLIKVRGDFQPELGSSTDNLR